MAHKDSLRKRSREEHVLHTDSGMVFRVTREYDPDWEDAGIGENGVVYGLEITDDEPYSESSGYIGISQSDLKELGMRLEALAGW